MLGSRELFPDLQPRIYLNHAAVSPPSVRVQAAVRRCLDDYAAQGLGAVFPWMDQRERLRAQLGALMGAAPASLALSSSTNRALMDLATCYPWKDGDRVLVFDGEFPANVTPWQQAARAHGAEAVMLPLAPFHHSVGAGLESVERELKRGLRLVAVSAVQFSTGLRMPLAELSELAHRYGAEIAVDGIQALGVVPLDVSALQLDYLAGGAHKWLMGLEGAGFLYVRPGRETALVPRVAGWLSHEDPVGFLMEGAGRLRYDRAIRTSPDFLEIGSTNALGFAALEAGLAPILELGVPAIFEHVQSLLEPLDAAVRALGLRSERVPHGRSGILAVRTPTPGDELTLSHQLAERGVSVSTPDGRLRFAPSWPNDRAQIDALIGLLQELRG